MNKESILNFTEEEINLEIAKFMGLKFELIEGIKGKGCILYDEIKLDTGIVKYPISKLPDYCNDLNLVYQVEEKIYKWLDNNHRSRGEYISNINSIFTEPYNLTDLLHASALNRCKAILLTIKESEDNA